MIQNPKITTYSTFYVGQISHYFRSPRDYTIIFSVKKKSVKTRSRPQPGVWTLYCHQSKIISFPTTIMYTKTSVSISEALLSPVKSKCFLKLLRDNPLLEEVEIINTYTIGKRKTDLFQTGMWTLILQHAGLQSIVLHNTNCVPQKTRQYEKKLVCSVLHELCITFCDLNTASISWIAANFTSHQHLARLVLSDNAMTDESIKVLCNMILANHSVSYLDISNNNFGYNATGYICQMLTDANDACKLETLVLESNRIADAGATLLAGTLNTNTKLCMLNVKNNNIARDGVLQLVNMLFQNTNLLTLSLANNYQDESTQHQLQSALQTNTTLRSLDVSMLRDESTLLSNHYTDWNTRLNMVELLKASWHIHYIRFDGIHTSTHEIRRMQAQLAQNTSLCRISFSGCGLTLSDANELAQGIGQNASIQHLDLSNNKLCRCSKIRHNPHVLGDRFWQAIGCNKVLQVIRLGGNMLGTESMWAASSFITSNETLIQLDITNNNIGDMGALVMLHALSNNTHLEQLDLRQNNTYALSFSKLLSNIIKQRICMQQKNILHVHGIALNITLNEMRLFKRTRIHRTMQISKNDIIEIWTQDCIARKSAFMLLTCPRLYHGPFSHLCIDTLRIILSFNIMYA